MTNKRRPTVGDRVRLLSVDKHHLELGFDVGQVHTIDEDDNDIAPYCIGGAYFREEMVELVEDEPDQHSRGIEMTTQRELGEMLIKAAETGRKMQIRPPSVQRLGSTSQLSRTF